MDAEYIEMAIRRYEAMAGLLHAVPEGLLRRAEADRAAFGAIYLYRDPTDDSFRWSSTHVLRFLVEICGLSYAAARDALIEELRTFDALDLPLPDPVTQARDLFLARGNIIEAIEAARLEADAWCHDPVLARHTQDVLSYVQSLAFVQGTELQSDWISDSY